ncbi:MAG: hypothetical protein WDL87_03015 [Candidatus Omnitrophota bacterium]|jgi:hypothetical protein
MKIAFCGIILFVLAIAGVCYAGSSSMGVSVEIPALERKYSCTYDRVQAAADRGEIKLKDAVILQAKLKFAPGAIAKDSPYAPLPGEKLVEEECGTGFYKQVHQVFPELNKAEKELLKSLSPDLKSIIETREKEMPVS